MLALGCAEQRVLLLSSPGCIHSSILGGVGVGGGG